MMLKALLAVFVTLLLLPCAAPDPALAQSSSQADDSDRFLLSIRGGVFLPSGGGDLFHYLKEHLSLEPDAFTAGSVTAEAGVRLGRRWVVAIGGNAAQGSEELTVHPENGHGDEGGVQASRLRLGASAYVTPRAYLFPLVGAGSNATSARRSWNAHAGAGGGLLGYDFRQWGAFRDKAKGETFDADFISRGSAPFAFLYGGLDVSVGSRAEINIESRYQTGRSDLKGDFREIGSIDLSGLGFTVGLTRRF